MILESIVTSVDTDGNVNIAPMGPRVDGLPPEQSPETAIFTLRPFKSSRTYDNLIQTGKAVIHVTDDVDLFARAAVNAIGDDTAVMRLVRRIDDTAWWVLKDCHRWFAITVDSVTEDELRVEMRCRVERSQVVRPFFGFNRGKHAVIEAAILATRTDLLPAKSIDQELQRLQPLIDKTAGPAEHSAFEFLRKTIHERLASR